MLITVVLIVAGLFVLLAAFLYFGQGRLVFIPSRTIDVTPDQVGLSYEDLFIEVAEDQKINAWYFPAPDSSRSGKTVLFCHGNAGNISHRLQTVQLLLDLGVNVLIFDYRGYGRSDGQPSEENVYADAGAAHGWLVEKKGVRPADLYLFGRSLGGNIAVELATRVECAGLVVESSFTSAAEIGQRLYPFMPIKLLARYRFDAGARIRKVTCPVLVTHSPTDEMIPYDMGRELFELARSEKQFFELEGGHNDLTYFDNPQYINALHRFFATGGEPGAGSGEAPGQNR